jgi:hypothetical protein
MTNEQSAPIEQRIAYRYADGTLRIDSTLDFLTHAELREIGLTRIAADLETDEIAEEAA